MEIIGVPNDRFCSLMTNRQKESRSGKLLQNRSCQTAREFPTEFSWCIGDMKTSHRLLFHGKLTVVVR